MAEPRVLWVGENLNLQFSRQVIFKDASFNISEMERVALVGRNGQGKSTLLKVISGEEKITSGKITMAKNLRMYTMPQDFHAPQNITALDIIQQGLDYYNSLLKKLETVPQKSVEYEYVQHELTFHDAWNPIQKMNLVLERLKISQRMQKTDFRDLSGGEQHRVLLARCLTAEPDLLLLDEPTNHLDIQTIQWLENCMIGYHGACLFVTHDRYFLDRTATRIVELEFGNFYSTKGTYTDFMEAHVQRIHDEDVLEQKRQAFLRKEIEWVRRSPKARLKKNLGREQRFYDIQAQTAPERLGEIDIVIPKPNRLGNKVLNLKNVSLALGGKTLFSNFSYEFTSGHKVGIVGANGCGKTSLLKVITGSVSPDSGSVERADTVEFNYIDQKRVKLNGEMTVLEEISEGHDFIQLGKEKITIWNYLHRFLFDDDSIKMQIKYLSGGEKARLILAKLLKCGGNFLILDEPTNDLDLPSLRILEEALAQYPSTLIIVSHDRYFMNRICNHIIAFQEDGSISAYIGDYDTYSEKNSIPTIHQERVQKESSESNKKQISESSNLRKQIKKKLSYMDERELNQIESDIPEYEQQLADAEAEFSDPELFSKRPKEVPSVEKKVNELKEKLNQLYERWEYLEIKKEELLNTSK